MTTTPTKRSPTKAGAPTPTTPGSGTPSITREDVERRQVAAYGAEADSSSYMPELSVSMGAKHLPIVRQPALPFVLLWNPACWDVDGRRNRRLVPRLRNLPLEPGASGVASGANGRPDITSHARAHWESKGYRAIPYELGPGGRSYVRKVMVDPTGEGRSERAHYCTPFERYYSGVQNAVVDTDAYIDWICALVEADHIAQCPLPVAVKILSGLVTQRDAAAVRAKNGNTSASERVTQLQADIEIVNAYIESIAPSRPAPDAVPVEFETVDMEAL